MTESESHHIIFLSLAHSVKYCEMMRLLKYYVKYSEATRETKALEEIFARIYF